MPPINQTIYSMIHYELRIVLYSAIRELSFDALIDLKFGFEFRKNELPESSDANSSIIPK